MPRSAILKTTIKIIKEKDVQSTMQQLESGRFGTCFMLSYLHFKACSKVFKHNDHNTLVNETNILSEFASERLP